MIDQSALNIRTQGEQLLDLTQAMLAAAKADDWGAFELLELQRSVLLERIFSNPADAESAKLHLIEVVKEILLIDQAICKLISQQRDLAAEELRYLKQARVGNMAYQIAADT